jgi:hypothetical protein
LKRSSNTLNSTAGSHKAKQNGHWSGGPGNIQQKQPRALLKLRLHHNGHLRSQDILTHNVQWVLHHQQPDPANPYSRPNCP